jgi:hypothetical protein
MLLARPARALYRHHQDLYLLMLTFATEYRWLVRAGVVLVAAAFARFLMTQPSVLAAFGL